MNTNSLQVEIDRQATHMGAYHGAIFSKHAMAYVARTSPNTLNTADIMSFAQAYNKAVTDERNRIISIDAALKDMPPGCEDLAYSAKYETRSDAATFRQHAIRALGQASHAMSRMRR